MNFRNNTLFSIENLCQDTENLQNTFYLSPYCGGEDDLEIGTKAWFLSDIKHTFKSQFVLYCAASYYLNNNFVLFSHLEISCLEFWNCTVRIYFVIYRCQILQH